MSWLEREGAESAKTSSSADSSAVARASASVPQAGLADLVKALSFGESYRDSLAEMLGYERTPRQIGNDAGKGEKRLPSGTGMISASVSDHQRVTFQPESQTFWRAETFRLLQSQSPTSDEGGKEVQLAFVKDSTSSEGKMRTAFETLAPMSDLVPRLRRLTELSRPGSELDLPRIIDDISHGRFRQQLPRLPKRGFGGGLHLVEDISERLAPYGIDQGLLAEELKDLMSATTLTVSTVSETGLRPRVHWPWERKGPLDSPAPESVMLVLSDLGALSTHPAPLFDAWRRFGEFLERQQVRRVALVPCAAERIPPNLTRLWTVLPWDHSRRNAGRQDANLLDGLATRLLAMLSFAVTIEPKLLRLVRSSVPDFRGYPELEAMVWQHGALLGSERCGISIKQTRRDILEAIRRQQDEDARHNAVHLAVTEHRRKYVGLRMAEVLNLGPDFFSPEEISEAAAWFEAINTDALPADPELQKRVAFFRVIAPHCTKAARERCPALKKNWDRYLSETPPDQSDYQCVRILHSSAGLVFAADNPPDTGSPICDIATRDARIGVTTFDIERDFWHDEAPDWAADWGIDEFGAWVELKVSASSHVQGKAGVGSLFSVGASVEHVRNGTQRLRWVPAGRFVMGSPEDEPGRYGDEGPQHEVTISRGFWMFDTPCTQAFYRAVTGQNPSEFKSPDRPVENVSWEDAQEFIDQLRSLEPGTEIGLPTEAEWEYACRAGTTDATYAGPIEILGDANAPVLDEIAWYGGNSNIEFELENGQDASQWLNDRQHGDKGGNTGTHPIREKTANPWGLYDMLGNVWEWCEDTKDEKAYERGAVTDPLVESSEGSAGRVIRGGGWYSYAQGVRAASRVWYSPEYRDFSLGFRCRVRGAEPSLVAAEQAEHVRKQARAGKGVSPERAVSGRSGKAEPREDSSPASGERTTATGSAMAQPTWIQLIDRQEESTRVPQGPVAKIISDVEELALRRISRPDWASAIGRDGFGLWAELKVEGQASRDEGSSSSSSQPSALTPQLLQRLRWIPPGRFTMGSPEGESGRWDGEFKPHPVVIPEGFWLFETPVTQALWELVMGNDSNQSEFRSADRPVEKVSWHDCQKFCSLLSDKLSKRTSRNETRLEVALPHEAEWEYACRAGTTEATYAGPFEDDSDTQSVLDSIAWYWGNSDDGTESDSEKKTHPVSEKSVNPWGLYDMLGNVYEWCSDVWRMPNESASEEVDERSADRVIRGGGWLSRAQHVRAACRHWYTPERRYDYLGFRCRVREFKSSEESSDSVSAERRSP